LVRGGSLNRNDAGENLRKTASDVLPFGLFPLAMEFCYHKLGVVFASLSKNLPTIFLDLPEAAALFF